MAVFEEKGGSHFNVVSGYKRPLLSSMCVVLWKGGRSPLRWLNDATHFSAPRATHTSPAGLLVGKTGIFLLVQGLISAIFVLDCNVPVAQLLCSIES
jgi:hypothetical protein